MKNPPPYVLPIIVFSQFCCTSLWFAGNAIMPELIADFSLPITALGSLTSAVQFGFILGTLVFAIFSISDSFSPTKVFFVCAVLGALFNLGVIWDNNNFNSLLLFRFSTGFFLAGIYPVGMKIASDYFEKGLGKSLGFLVGALVLGTAFPHLLNLFTQDIQWEFVLYFTSSLAFVGGLFMFFLADGPNRKKVQKPDFTAFFQVFKKKEFRASAFGYFGHMWELYAFWAFVPIFLGVYQGFHKTVEFNISLMSFIIIGVGSIACISGGYISESLGTKKTAAWSLSLSGLCCLISPIAVLYFNPALFIGFLIFWGMVVIADSPLFSTLVATHAPAENKGTALTIVNSIGFAITIISIQLLNILRIELRPEYLFSILAIGPVLGLYFLNSKNPLKAR